MSKRADVLLALLSCIGSVRPGMVVMGLAGDEAVPSRIPPLGRVVVRSGNPGEPDIDLSPAYYWYTHVIPLEVAMPLPAIGTAEQALSTLLREIEVAVLADPALNALCEHLEFTAPETADIGGGANGGAVIGRVADLDLMAFYGTPTPLS